MSRQCELLGLSRSSYYYEPASESVANLALMALIDTEYTAHPFRGSRGMRAWLRREGHSVNRKRVQRLMRLMGLEAVYPKPRLSLGGTGHKVYPYLLRNVPIERVNQVWSTDITYIPMPNGFMYLAAVIDWYSRYVLSWKLSNMLDVGFCLEALEEALSRGCPEVFNTDQGVQFTSASSFTNDKDGLFEHPTGCRRRLPDLFPLGGGGILLLVHPCASRRADPACAPFMPNPPDRPFPASHRSALV